MKDQQLDVVVVGELNIDLVLWQVPMPEVETEKLAQDMRFAMGSSSAITAHNLSALGSKVGFCGSVGEDIFGNFMVDSLAQAGVDITGIVRRSPGKTGATIVLANPPQKALLTYPGTMAEWTAEDLDWDFITSARHLHLGGYFLQTQLRPAVPHIFARAQKLGLTTSLDTNWDPDEQWGPDVLNILDHTNIFFPNQEEAQAIAHKSSREEAVETLAAHGPTLAITCGREGTLLHHQGQSQLISPFTVDAVETTGAGDSFTAGYLHHFLAGHSPEESAVYGNGCGALAVTEMGGTGAFAQPGFRDKLNSILSSR